MADSDQHQRTVGKRKKSESSAHVDDVPVVTQDCVLLVINVKEKTSAKMQPQLDFGCTDSC